MSLLTHRTWILSGLAVIVATFIGGRGAHAASVSGIMGIFIPVGMTQPIGDPTYKYLFDVQLLAGSTLSNGGYFTVYDLPYIGSGALTSQPNASWGSSEQFLGITPSARQCHGRSDS